MGSTDQPSWNIQVMQISCTEWWKPQDGCTQVKLENTFFDCEEQGLTLLKFA